MNNHTPSTYLLLVLKNKKKLNCTKKFIKPLAPVTPLHSVCGAKITLRGGVKVSWGFSTDYTHRIQKERNQSVIIFKNSFGKRENLWKFLVKIEVIKKS